MRLLLILAAVAGLVLGLLSGLWSAVCFLGGPHPTTTGDAVLAGVVFALLSLALLAGSVVAWRRAGPRRDAANSHPGVDAVFAIRATPYRGYRDWMPSEEKRDAPDPSDSYERSHPGNEPGLGKMRKTDNTPHEQEEGHSDSRDNNLREQEVNADEIQDSEEAVDPTDKAAHGNRSNADASEAIGKRRNQGKP